MNLLACALEQEVCCHEAVKGAAYVDFALCIADSGRAFAKVCLEATLQQQLQLSVTKLAGKVEMLLTQ